MIRSVISSASTNATGLAVLVWLSVCAADGRSFGPDAPASPPDLPPGFLVQKVADGLDALTSLTVTPDGRVLVCEQTGALRLVKGGELAEEPVLTVGVDSHWERGLLGVVCDPAFEENGNIYVCYTASPPYTHHRVSRFTLDGDLAIPDSEKVLFRGDDQANLGGPVPAGHQGGGIHLGPDGCLYIGIGEHTAAAPSQELDSLLGKMLRINRDGSIPRDNPFFDRTEGKYRAIWALGLRNPFGFGFQPSTGRLFINDVGSSLHEEINEGFAGANYGWPLTEGPTDDSRFRGPVHAYSDGQARSIAGGAFYEPARPMFPAEYQGKFLFIDYMQGWVRALDPLRPDATPATFATGLRGPVDLRVAPDGSVYLLSRNLWVKNDKYVGSTGALHRIVYAAANSETPRITYQSGDRLVAPGAWARLSITVSGASAETTYQWRRDGKPIPGAESPEFVLRGVGPSDAGRYRCDVTTSRGLLRSRPVQLRVAELAAAQAVPDQLAPGIVAARYKARGGLLPDFDKLRPERVETVDRIDQDALSGTVFDGLFNAPIDGVYEFAIAQRGAVKLFVAGHEVASAADPAGRLVTGTGAIGLRAGYHALQLRSVSGSDSGDLEATVALDGGDARPLAGAFLSHVRRDESQPFTPSPIDTSGLRRPPTTLHTPADPGKLPALLSQTGVFSSMEDLEPSAGVTPYSVNSPLWSDGAAKSRWAAVPAGGKVKVTREGDWLFPEGTVLIKHFELHGRRLETRLMRVDHTGMGWAVTYKWNEDQTDATLLGAGGVTEEVPVAMEGDRRQKWDYPSRDQCMVCHNQPSNFTLGLTTAQLNGEVDGVSQLRAWNESGLLDPPLSKEQINTAPALVAVDDPHASLTVRVRSYLDANCSMCHRPGGVRAEFDARFSTALADQGIINGKIRSGNTMGAGRLSADLGAVDPKIVKPGDVEASVLLQRMARRHSVMQMPPLASRVVDESAIIAFSEWIKSLESGSGQLSGDGS